MSSVFEPTDTKDWQDTIRELTQNGVNVENLRKDAKSVGLRIRGLAPPLPDSDRMLGQQLLDFHTRLGRELKLYYADVQAGRVRQ